VYYEGANQFDLSSVAPGVEERSRGRTTLPVERPSWLARFAHYSSIGVRLESAHRARWHCVTEQPSARPPGTARRGETRATGRSVARRRAITRICNRVVDLAAHCQVNRGALRILIQYQPGLTASGGDELELPTTREARIATQREGHCPVEEQTLAGAKKNAAAQRRTIVFIDESGLSERPTRVRTWSPKAQTPVLQYSFNWKQLSVIAGISYWQFYFRLFPGSIKGPQIIEFLKALKAQIKRKLLIIWDGLGVHKSCLVREFIESLNGHIEVEFLPAYAPELNPAEYIWGHLKQHEIANLCVKNLAELSPFARNRLR